jgi:Domain of unknown function (DUF5753)
MPDDERAPALDSFIADLNAAYRLAGPPTYGTVEKLSRHVKRVPELPGLRIEELSASTTNEILIGKRCRMPRWQWVASFLAILRVLAAEGGIDPNSLGSLTDWKARHEAADLAVREFRRPARAGATASASYHREAGTATSHSASTAAGSYEAGRASMLALARHARGWWQDYRDVAPGWFTTYLGLESAACQIRTYETRFVPGLLQTEAYAAAVARIGREHAPATEITHRVELRMHRQQLLNQANPVRLWAIIDEAALHQEIADAAVRRAQLHHLIDISAEYNVTIQVMPENPADGGALAGGPVSLLRFPDSELPDVVYLEHLTDVPYPEDQTSVDHYSKVLGRLAIEALEPTETTAKLRRILSEA